MLKSSPVYQSRWNRPEKYSSNLQNIKCWEPRFASLFVSVASATIFTLNKFMIVREVLNPFFYRGTSIVSLIASYISLMGRQLKIDPRWKLARIELICPEVGLSRWSKASGKLALSSSKDCSIREVETHPRALKKLDIYLLIADCMILCTQ